MKILTHFMQTTFGMADDKIRVQFLEDKSGIIITALVNDAFNDDAKCDVNKMESMALKSSLLLRKATDGEFEFAAIILTKDEVAHLARKAGLFYGWTAIFQELSNNPGFLYNSNTQGVTVDLGLTLSDFELFQMMHKVRMERFTLTGGLLSTATSKMAKVLNELRERKVSNEEGMNAVLGFAETNPNSNTGTILKENAHYFTKEFQSRIQEWQQRVEQTKPAAAENNTSWLGMLGFT